MEYNIFINDTIGWPISAKYVRQELDKCKKKPCNVFINSFGGAVSDALEIRQMFLDHGDVTCYVYGMTASAATILAMGAKKIVMGKFALMLIHKVSNWVDTWGSMNADDLAAAIEELQKNKEDLDTIDQVLANLYAAKTGKTPEEMAAIMKDEKWLPSDKCKELGLIDEISEEDQPSVVTDALKGRIIACGFPVPSIAAAQPTAQPAEESMMHAFTSALKSFFGKKDNSAQPQKPNNNSNMKKIFVNICALLAIDALMIGENKKAELTEDQLSAIEGQLASLANEKKSAEDKVSSLQKEIDALKEQVTNLQKGDGDDTHQVTEEPSDIIENPIADARKAYDNIKNTL